MTSTVAVASTVEVAEDSATSTNTGHPWQDRDPWRAVLSGQYRRDAQRVATEVAGRVLDPARRAAATERAHRDSAYSDTVGWHAVDVAQGDAGLALLAAALDDLDPEAGWDAAAHRSLRRAVEGAHVAYFSPRLFGGLSGLAFAASCASRGGQRYRHLLSRLDATIAEQVVPMAQHLARRTEGVGVSEYDLIYGLSGTGAYLLTRATQAGAGPEVRVALDSVLRGLVSLVTPGSGAPRWWTPEHLLNDPTMVDRFPGGLLNCGLAHGLPGPLALLALSLRRGIAVPGLAEAVQACAGWLARHRVDDRWGPNWPIAVATVPGGREDFARSERPGRAAWCYGAPGVARSLSLAGAALGDSGLVDLAVESMRAVFRRPIDQRGIAAPSLCHGVAGLAQVTLRLAADTGQTDLAAVGAELARDLLAEYDPDSAVGYQNVEPSGVRVDQPGFLEGAAGVALVLLAAGSDAEPSWDRLMLLS